MAQVITMGNVGFLSGDVFNVEKSGADDGIVAIAMIWTFLTCGYLVPILREILHMVRITYGKI